MMVIKIIPAEGKRLLWEEERDLIEDFLRRTGEMVKKDMKIEKIDRYVYYCPFCGHRCEGRTEGELINDVFFHFLADINDGKINL